MDYITAITAIAIGVIASLLTNAISNIVSWLRRPFYIPYKPDSWSKETREMMEKLGWSPEKMDWVIDDHVVARENQRWKVVKVGFPARIIMSRERGKDEFVMMMK